jgi:subtilisin family serine protease
MDLVTSLALRADVAEITANHKFQLEKPILPSESLLAPHAIEPNITFIHADEVWAMGITGAGTVLAGNDTGLDETHPAIARHYRGCLNPPTCSFWDHDYNWWDSTGEYPTEPWDPHGHGTHTTGIIIGDDGGSNQIGVAPGAQTIHCKNMTGGGGGDDSTFTECFQWTWRPGIWNGENRPGDGTRCDQ